MYVTILSFENCWFIIIIKTFLYFLELCETSLQDDPVSFVNTVYR